MNSHTSLLAGTLKDVKATEFPDDGFLSLRFDFKDDLSEHGISIHFKTRANLKDFGKQISYACKNPQEHKRSKT